MAGKADFTEDEWKTLSKGVTGTGMLVSLAHKDFTDSFGEATALAKEMANQHTHNRASSCASWEAPEARASASPHRPRRPRRDDRGADRRVSLLKTKAPDELEAYRAFVLDIGQTVAAAKGGVVPAETEVIEKVKLALASGEAADMTRRPSREATLRAIGITVVVAIGVVFLLGLWVGHTYGTLYPLVPPPKLNVFGRDYRPRRNQPKTRAGVLATTRGDPVDILEPAVGAWPFATTLGPLGDRARHDGRLAACRTRRVPGVRAERRS